MTIKDLAERTGYSVGTVSRVLNNQPNASAKAREIILRAAEESGFQLNVNAKQLKQQCGTGILAVVKGTSNELFAGLVEVLQSRAVRAGYPLVVDYLEEECNEVAWAIRRCREKKPLGVLFLGGNRENFLADFGKLRLPCVLVTNDAADLPFSNLSSVSSDNILAARLAIGHLAALGHRKIAVIGGDRDQSDTTRQRFLGCLEAFREHGIDFDEADYAAVRFSYAGGRGAVEELLARNREFTALFAMSDVMAIGAIRALADAGKRVPEDVSVVGFDGLTTGQFTVPRLATVRQDVEQLAQRSLDLLLEAMGGSTAARHETVSVTLLENESARKL